MLDDVLPRNHAVNDSPVEHEFEAIGHRTMLLDARCVNHLELTQLAMEDIIERRQAERQITELLENQVGKGIQARQILHDITLAANEAATVEEALKTTLRCICNFNHWQVGHVWRLDEDRDLMVSADIWYVDETTGNSGIRLKRLREITSRTSISSGESLVGRVRATGDPEWINDLQEWELWERGDAEALGLRAAIAFPVTVDSDATAVLECFSDRPLQPERRFLEIMPDVGIQLGHGSDGDVSLE